MHTVTYRGYKLKYERGGNILVYRGRRYITWFMSMDQAKRMIDEAVL